MRTHPAILALSLLQRLYTKPRADGFSARSPDMKSGLVKARKQRFKRLDRLSLGGCTGRGRCGFVHDLICQVTSPKGLLKDRLCCDNQSMRECRVIHAPNRLGGVVSRNGLGRDLGECSEQNRMPLPRGLVIP